MRWRCAGNLRSRCIIAVAMAIAVSAVASARGPEVFEVAGLAPVGSDLVVVVDDAQRLRTGGLGALVRDLLLEGSEEAPKDSNANGALPTFNETMTAWAALSNRLGWAGDEAFDRLFGQRAMLVVHRSDEGREWAVVSWVTPEVGERVRKRLNASLRSSLGGHPLFALEHGRYEMVVGGQRDAPVLYLWPGDAGGLGRSLVTGGRINGSLQKLADCEAMGLTKRIARGELGGDPDVLVMAGLPRPGAEGGGLARGDWIAGMAEVQDNAIDLAFVDSDAKLRPQLGQIEPWAFGMFRALAADSLATAVVSGVALRTLDAGSIPEELAATLRRLTGEAQVVPSRVAACVRAAPGGGVDISIGVESTNDPDLASRGDAFMERMLTDWFGEVHYKTGRMRAGDDEVRRVPFKGGVSLPWDGLAWTYRHCSPLIEGCASVWWAGGVGTPGSVEEFAELVSANYLDTEIQPWVEIVDLHPRKLIGALEGGGAIALPKALGQVEHASWRRFAVPSEGVVVGKGRIEFTE